MGRCVRVVGWADAVGEPVGFTEGGRVGMPEGGRLGYFVGILLGIRLGCFDGGMLGPFVGVALRFLEGAWVGSIEGNGEGRIETVGCVDGMSDGIVVGELETEGAADADDLRFVPLPPFSLLDKTDSPNALPFSDFFTPFSEFDSSRRSMKDGEDV